MPSYDERWMRRAVELAGQGAASGAGGPFGALVVRGGEVVAEGYNRVIQDGDPTAHAEVVAIRRACTALGSFQLTGCELYTSCEPCPMCLGAVFWARPDVVYYGAGRDDAAAAGFDDSFIYDQLALGHAERHIPFIRHDTAGALDVFAQWVAKSDRVEY